jgi:hypothetical protein
MSTQRIGRRHSLLLYRRSFDQLWKISLPVGVALLLTQQFFGRTWPGIGYVPTLPSLYDGLLLLGWLILLGAGLFGLLARNLAYVQARGDHLRINTPFTQIKVSYRRIRSLHPSNVSQVFPRPRLSRSMRSFLEPFMNETALIIDLTGLPLSKGAMRLFLGSAMLLPATPGLVLLVPDWMSLSTELDSNIAAWRQASSASRSQSDPRNSLLRNLQK